MSLFGRPQDRLSHILISEPFESSWDFFYPTPYSRVITMHDNKLADTANAEVILTEIPFVRLRDGLPDRLLAGKANRLVAGEMSAELERAEQALTNGMTAEYFEQRKSRTNSALEQVLDRQLAAPYLIHGDGRKPRTRFGLRIEAERIRFGSADDAPASLREAEGDSEIGENAIQREIR